jgi:osmotically-inducible protein OsmY
MSPDMKKLHLITVLLVGTLVGCSSKGTQYPDVKDNIRSEFDTHGWKDVSVTQDRDKGVVTLTGHVAADADKTEAASVAQRIATNQVVSNQITVEPQGAGSDVRKVSNDIDDGIERGMKVLLKNNQPGDDVSYDVKSGVVTLTGSVNSQARRTQIESQAKKLANVTQVVNELQVKDQKATTSQGTGK